LILPYTAEPQPQGGYQLLEQAFHSTKEQLNRFDTAVQQIVQMASQYTDRSLMKLFSREKTHSDFLRKLTEKDWKEHIRPFIEEKLAAIMEVIRIHQLALYQKQPGSKLLLPHHAYQVGTEPIQVRFHFRIEEDSFRYRLYATRAGEEIDLTEKNR